MNEESQNEYIAALVELHSGLERKGPGDDNFSRKILASLSTLPPKPQMADLGCGSGVSALLLAKYFNSTVKAVDASSVFIEELKSHAKQAKLQDLIIPILGDMGTLDWPESSVDLIWSEGAAYNLGFEVALQTWRPLLKEKGIAVISEMTWFSDDIPEPAATFWQNAYPSMGTEPKNIDRANQSGYTVLSTHRLPSQAWWNNYYGPLRDRMKQMPDHPTTQLVIQETEEEITLFEKFSDFYGYTFYILQAN